VLSAACAKELPCSAQQSQHPGRLHYDIVSECFGRPNARPLCLARGPRWTVACVVTSANARGCVVWRWETWRAGGLLAKPHGESRGVPHCWDGKLEKAGGPGPTYIMCLGHIVLFCFPAQSCVTRSLPNPVVWVSPHITCRRTGVISDNVEAESRYRGYGA
jgi:hypothetical protein